MGVENIAPKFTKKPSLKQEGNSINFNCEIEASPEPDIVWYRGNTPLSDDDRIKTSVTPLSGTAKYTLKLVVQNVGPQDSGTYKVEAKNKFGQMAANINLNLQSGPPAKGGAPSFTQKPAIRQVDGGKRILFECKMAADPMPILTWFREDVQLSNGGRYRFISEEESAGSFYVALELSDPQPVDGATYKLHAKNQHGESNANLKLNFDVSQAQAGSAPKFTAKPSIRQVGSGVIFEVRLTADPSPAITWYKGDTVISEGGRYNITTQTDGMNYTLFLEISDISTDDGGAYKVTAKNKLGESNANINLNLGGSTKKEGKPPKFLEKPSIKQQGSMIVMSVLLEAKPEPTVTWSRGGTVVKHEGRYVLRVEKGSTADSYRLVCEITDPTGEDGGSYKCSAQNDLGTSNANLALNIEKPQAKQMKIEVPVVKGEPSIRQEVKNKKIIITLMIGSAEQPNVQWMFGGQTLNLGGRYITSVTKQGGDYVLLLECNEVTVKDSGDYKCVIRNAAGEIVKIIPVTVQAPKDDDKKKKDEKKKKEPEPVNV